MAFSFQEVAAGMTEKISRDLDIAARNTRDNRLLWRPMERGRTVFDQLIECSFANRKWTYILREGAYRTLTTKERETLSPKPETLETILALLQETTAELAATIRALPDDVVAQRWPLEWNTEVTRSVAEACLHPYWNMAYHEGQINYIQTLYDDQNEYADSGPFGEG